MACVYQERDRNRETDTINIIKKIKIEKKWGVELNVCRKGEDVKI